MSILCSDTNTSSSYVHSTISHSSHLFHDFLHWYEIMIPVYIQSHNNRLLQWNIHLLDSIHIHVTSCTSTWQYITNDCFIHIATYLDYRAWNTIIQCCTNWYKILFSAGNRLSYHHSIKSHISISTNPLFSPILYHLHNN